jgi:hypothetical protein
VTDPLVIACGKPLADELRSFKETISELNVAIKVMWQVPTDREDLSVVKSVKDSVTSIGQTLLKVDKFMLSARLVKSQLMPADETMWLELFAKRHTGVKVTLNDLRYAIKAGGCTKRAQDELTENELLVAQARDTTQQFYAYITQQHQQQPSFA